MFVKFMSKFAVSAAPGGASVYGVGSQASQVPTSMPSSGMAIPKSGPASGIHVHTPSLTVVPSVKTTTVKDLKTHTPKAPRKLKITKATNLIKPR